MCEVWDESRRLGFQGGSGYHMYKDICNFQRVVVGNSIESSATANFQHHRDESKLQGLKHSSAAGLLISSSSSSSSNSRGVGLRCVMYDA